MSRRVAAIEIVSILVISFGLALLGGTVINTLLNAGEPVSLLAESARLLFGVLPLATLLWMAAVAVIALTMRRRSTGARIGAFLGSLVVAIALNLGIYAVLVPPDGGMGDLVIGIGIAAGLVLLVAAVVGVLVTELVIVRRLGRSARRGGPSGDGSPVSAPSAAR